MLVIHFGLFSEEAVKSLHGAEIPDDNAAYVMQFRTCKNKRHQFLFISLELIMYYALSQLSKRVLLPVYNAMVSGRGTGCPQLNSAMV